MTPVMARRSTSSRVEVKISTYRLELGMIWRSLASARRSLAPGPEISTYASPVGRPSMPSTSFTLSSVNVPQPCADKRAALTSLQRAYYAHRQTQLGARARHVQTCIARQPPVYAQNQLRFVLRAAALLSRATTSGHAPLHL